MSEKLVAAGLRAGAIKAIKLADMKGANLDVEHKAWLDQMIAQASGLVNVEVYIIAFSSKRGSIADNESLSKDRAWLVRDYIYARSEWLASRITRWEYRGEEEAAAFGRNLDTETDLDDYHWRAVEVHLLGNFKPTPKPNEDPTPPTMLPGASVNWAMSSVFSVSMTIPGTGIANVGIAFFIFQKLDKDKGIGLYISMPVGASLSLTQLTRWLKLRPKSSNSFEQQLVEALIKGLVGGGVKSLTSLCPPKAVMVQNPFRHKDLEGAGIVLSELVAAKFVSVSGKLPTFDRHGKIVNFSTKTFFEKFKIEMPMITPSGNLKDFDINIGKFTGGGLLRLCWLHE